ncbi:flagellar biosynthetic protein FliO [Caldisalinibacter kiritimatiensis]|uniref:Flagellar biosynthesis protein FliZ n=1 Tax=Caldisalinibacter kiritimatiensis TaxID=1304284 RepID=R1CSN1_9FIRM|nr:flagellar biosynthetic protein FliO [Caldisalinibacter kiritimatiensis]EOC99718.1 hypothetical protein L21TH_2248 [Caldisalinibacter kiritimatiensis]
MSKKRLRNINVNVFTFIFVYMLRIEVFAYQSSKINDFTQFKLDSMLKLVFYLIAFFAVLFLSYFTSKVIGKKSSTMIKSKNISIIDSMSIGRNSRIMIVKILNSLYIVAVNENQTTVLDKIDDNQIIENIENIVSKDMVNGNYLKNISDLFKNNKSSRINNMIINKKLNNINQKLKNIRNYNNIDLPIDEDEEDE